MIAVNRSSVPEVAGDAAELLELGHPDEIRFAIERLMDTATRDELVRRGKVQATKFSWNHTFQSTVAVYKELTGTRLL